MYESNLNLHSAEVQKWADGKLNLTTDTAKYTLTCQLSDQTLQCYKYSLWIKQISSSINATTQNWLNFCRKIIAVHFCKLMICYLDILKYLQNYRLTVIYYETTLLNNVCFYRIQIYLIFFITETFVQQIMIEEFLIESI